MLGSREDADDVLHEVFLTVYRKLDGFKGDSALGTWLYRLTMNRCVDFLRQRRARHGKETGAVEALATRGAATASAELRLDLERAVGALPEGCRAAFLLHDVEGLQHREIGEVLGISVGTSKSQLHRARMRLRELLTGRVSESSGALAPPRPS